MGSNGGQTLGAVAGGVGGFMIGGPVGAAAGMSAGAALGGMLDGPESIDRSVYGPNSQEASFTNALMARSAGTGGPSVAEQQMQMGLGQANADAMSLAASQRGVSPALAARLAAQAQSQNAMAVSGQTGMLRAQEQMNADQTLAQVLSSQRASRQAGSAAEFNAANAASNRQAGLISSVGQGMMGMGSMGGGGGGGGTGGTGGGGGYAQTTGRLGANTQLQGDPAYMSKGGHVPGKAMVEGDHEANDIVDAKLSPGEIVVPRTKAKDPEKAKAFIDELMKGKKGKPKGDDDEKEMESLGDILSKQKKLDSRLARIEKKLDGE